MPRPHLNAGRPLVVVYPACCVVAVRSDEPAAGALLPGCRGRVSDRRGREERHRTPVVCGGVPPCGGLLDLRGRAAQVGRSIRRPFSDDFSFIWAR